jgi:hypothetical protein
MVGHDIKQLSQPHLAQSLAKSQVRDLATQFVIHSLMIDHIVTMHAGWGRLQVWRAVYMRDPQRVQVLCNRRSIIEIETFMELYPVCGTWNPWHCYQPIKYAFRKQGSRKIRQILFLEVHKVPLVASMWHHYPAYKFFASATGSGFHKPDIANAA